MELLPWWVYIVIAGIIISGYMVLYTSKKEQEIDQEFIEREGDVYMKRIQQERQRREEEEKDSTVLL